MTEIQENAYVGIRKCLGILEGKEIVVDLYLEQWEGKRSIRYRIYERDPDSSFEMLKAVGFLGAWDDGWQLNKPETLSFKRCGNTIGFWVNGYDATIYYRPIKVMESLDAPVETSVWTDTGPKNIISAMVKEVSVIYPGWGGLLR